MCEYAQAYTSTVRTARKTHKCCECGIEINRGDRYRYDSGIFDHQPFSHKRCSDCYELLEFVHALPETDCIDVDLYEHLSECEYIDHQPHDEEYEHGSYCSITAAVPWLKLVKGHWRLNKIETEVAA